MKIFIFLLLFCLIATSPAPAQNPHKVRIGWGDMLFESMAFREASPALGGKGFTGHIFAEYQYDASKVVSVGGQVDFEGIFTADMNNYNLVIMPTVRFTYLRKPWVELYSGLGAGLLCAMDNQGGAEFAPALNLNLFGVQLGPGPFSVGIELGALNSLLGSSSVYMLGARLLSVSLNYRF